MEDNRLLEKMDALRQRTGISYREAREVLERNDGDVIEALIELESMKPAGWTEELSQKSGEVLEKVKGFIRQGNVTKIRVKQDGRVLVEIPVTLGAIGAMLLPQLAALGTVVAVFKKCTIEVVHEDKTGGQTTETIVEEPVEREVDKER